MENLDNFLKSGNSTKERVLDDGSKEVCDLITGDCYIVKEKDGLIERADNSRVVNRHVKVKTVAGIKELLNG
jgi:hypothetical protein